MCIEAIETSQYSDEYNCFAWVMKDKERWWGTTQEDDYWPTGVTREETLTAYIEAYEQYGYETCESESFEEGFEKIAIYVDHNQKPTHAARQKPDGTWTSKLGIFEDVKHEFSTNLIINFPPRGEQDYGTLAVLMKRHEENTRVVN